MGGLKEFLCDDDEIVAAPTARSFKRSVSSFIEKEYYEYAMYSVEQRAIPSVIDGLKPVHRKVLWTASKDARSFIKTKALTGAVMHRGIYHHGDGSLDGAISLMAAPWANNIPLLEGKGSFGSRMTGAAGIASPRYTSVRLGKAFDAMFLDNDQLEYGQDEDDAEPTFFLPSVPWVLVNGTSGMAVGFACEYQPYNISDIIENMRRVIARKEMLPMLPWFKDFRGKVTKEPDGCLYSCGTFEVNHTTKLTITEIPIGMSKEQFVDRLIDMEYRKKIVDFQDRCRGKIEFVVKHNRGAFVDDADIIKQFRLKRKLNENLVAINESGRVIVFDNANEIIEYFVNYKLSRVYPRRKELMERRLIEEKQWNEAVIKLIDEFRAGNIDFRIIKSKADLIAAIKTHVSPANSEHTDRLASMPIHQINSERAAVSSARIAEIVLELEALAKTTTTDMMLSDLRASEKSLKALLS